MGSFLSTRTTAGLPVTKKAEEAVMKGRVHYLQYLHEEKLLNCNFGAEYTLKTILLHKAAQNGIYNCLHYLLEIGANPNVGIDKSRNNALHACVHCQKQDSIRCCKLLLKNKVNINATNVWQRTPLLTAIIHYNFKVARLLISEKASVNRYDENGASPLIVCASYGERDLVDILIKCGADINHKDNRGRTALYFAIVGKHTAIFHDLLLQGSNLDSLDIYGETLIHLSLSKCNLEIVKCLIESGICMTHPQSTYFDICLKIIQSAMSKCISTPGPPVEHQVSPVSVTKQALDSLVCTRLVIAAHGNSIKKTVRPNKLGTTLKKFDEALRNSLENKDSPELRMVLRSVNGVQNCIQMASEHKSKDADTLQNICNRRCRQYFMSSGKNVIWAVNQINVPQILKELLLLNM